MKKTIYLFMTAIILSTTFLIPIVNANEKTIEFIYEGPSPNGNVSIDVPDLEEALEVEIPAGFSNPGKHDMPYWDSDMEIWDTRSSKKISFYFASGLPYTFETGYGRHETTTTQTVREKHPGDLPTSYRWEGEINGREYSGRLNAIGEIRDQRSYTPVEHDFPQYMIIDDLPYITEDIIDSDGRRWEYLDDYYESIDLFDSVEGESDPVIYVSGSGDPFEGDTIIWDSGGQKVSGPNQWYEFSIPYSISDTHERSCIGSNCISGLSTEELCDEYRIGCKLSFSNGDFSRSYVEPWQVQKVCSSVSGGESCKIFVDYRTTLYRPESFPTVYERRTGQKVEGWVYRDYSGEVRSTKSHILYTLPPFKITYRAGVVNREPGIDVSTSGTQRVSAVSGYNTITLKGKAWDPDRDDVKVSATIGGVTKSTTVHNAPSSRPGSDNWTLTWTLPGNNISSGTYSNITVKADDQKGLTKNSTFTGSIVVDRIKPSISSVSIRSNNSNSSWAKSGDQITLTFNSSETLMSNPTVRIAGKTASVSRSGNSYTAKVTMGSSDTQGNVSVSITNIKDVVGNTGNNVSSTSNGSSVTYDRTNPSISNISISSNNSNSGWARSGNTVTLTFRSSETLSTNPTVRIAGKSASVSKSGNNYTATVTMGSSDPEGTISISISNIRDRAGNTGTNRSGTNDGSSVIYDRTSPSISNVSIRSNNSNTSLAKSGDIITLTFRSSETLGATPTVRIAGKTASVSRSGNNYTATVTMGNSDSEGNVSVQISGIRDRAGNTRSNVTSTNDGSSVRYDRTRPTLTNVNIRSNNSNTSLAKSGDQIILTFTSSESLSSNPSVKIAGKTATISKSGNNYTARVTMGASDNEGTVSISITGLRDLAGNTGNNVTSTSNGSSVRYDRTPPKLTSVTLSSSHNNNSLAKPGDTITLNFTASEALKSNPSVRIAGNSASVSKLSGNKYRASYVMREPDDEGNIGFTISSITDLAGNNGTNVTRTTNGSSIRFYRIPPQIRSATVSSNNSNSEYAKVGDVITLNFEVTKTLSRNPKVDIAGRSASVSKVSGNRYRATYTMRSSDPEGEIPIKIYDIVDSHGTTTIVMEATTDGSFVTFDKTKPVVSNVSLRSSNPDPTQATAGDKAILSFVSSEALKNNPTVRIAGNVATVTKTGNSYTAEYTLKTSDLSGPISVRIENIRDMASNVGDVVDRVSDGSYIRTDSESPGIQSVSIKSNNSDPELAKVGDTITIEFTPTVKLQRTPLVEVEGNRANVVRYGSNSYRATYVVKGTEPTGPVSFEIKNITSMSGVNGTVVTNTTDGSEVRIVTGFPSLDRVSIESSNPDPSRAKVGDRITVVVESDRDLSRYPIVNIGGNPATVSRKSTKEYEASYVMSERDREGKVDIVIDEIVDEAGIGGSPVRNTTDGSEVIFKKTKPELERVEFVEIDDEIVLEFESTDPLRQIPVVEFDGNPVPVVNIGGGNYRATYPGSGESGRIDFLITDIYDLSGNRGDDVSSTTDGSGASSYTSGPITIVVAGVEDGRTYSGDSLALYSASSSSGTINSLSATLNGSSYVSGTPIRGGTHELVVTATDTRGNRATVTLNFIIN